MFNYEFAIARENRDSLQVYAVYGTEINCPEGETPLEWMLLTTEVVEDIETEIKMLRWYTYRWRVEDYHKIFKSGCKCERYRLAAESMKPLCRLFKCLCRRAFTDYLSTS